MVTTDEEIGGRDGAARLVAEGWSTDLLVNGDGGHGDAVSYAEKGIVQVELLAKTTPGQRYAPWDGQSAANILIETLASGLRVLCPDQDSLDSERNWGTTSCILKLESGTSTPMPPDRASASVRFYWAGSESAEEIRSTLEKAFPAIVSSVEIVAEPVHTDPEDENLLLMRTLLEKHFDRPFGIKADNGASDAKWFAPLKVPIVLLRFPGGGAHTPEEWLELDAFVPLYNTLMEFVSLTTQQNRPVPVATLANLNAEKEPTC